MSLLLRNLFERYRVSPTQILTRGEKLREETHGELCNLQNTMQSGFIDLNWLAHNCKQTLPIKYFPNRFAAATCRLIIDDNCSATFLIFPGNNVVGLGLKDFDSAYYATHYLNRLFLDHDVQVLFSSFVMRLLVYDMCIPMTTGLSNRKLFLKISNQALYQPELFPAIRYYPFSMPRDIQRAALLFPEEPALENICILLFETGECILTGIRTVNMIYFLKVHIAELFQDVQKEHSIKGDDDINADIRCSRALRNFKRNLETSHARQQGKEKIKKKKLAR